MLTTALADSEAHDEATEDTTQQNVLIAVLKRTGILGDLISWEDGVYGTSESVFAGGA
jgi:hypothetical protein